MPDDSSRPPTELQAEVERLRARVAELEALVPTAIAGKAAQSAPGKAADANAATLEPDAERLFHAAASAVSQAVGQEFFKRLVEHLARSLSCEFAEIGVVVPGSPSRIRTLAFYGGGRLQANIEYDLADTPCQGVLGTQFCIFPSQVRKLFPRDAFLREAGAESYAGIPLFGAEGNVLGLICVVDTRPLPHVAEIRSALQIFAARAAAEIERQQVLESLADSRRQLEMALVAGHVGIGQWDIATGAMHWSDGLAPLLGLSREALGPVQSLRDLVHPDDLPELQRRMQATLENGVPYRAEFRLRRADGEWIWIFTQGELTRDAQGRPQTLIGTILDITERKRFEAELQAGREALAESERIFRQLAESIRDVYWMFDLAQERLIYLSPAFEAMTGRTTGWLVEEPGRWQQLIHPDDREKVARHIEDFRAGQAFDETYRIAHADGSFRWIHDRRFAVHDEGEITRIAGVAEDITERIVAAERMHEQTAQLAHVARLSSMGELVASIAHEVNQPLYVIGNFASAIASGLADDAPPIDKLKKWTDEISKAVNRADGIIRRLRSYVSKGPAQRVLVDANAVVLESVELVAFEARRHRAHVVLDLAPQLPQLLADPVAIQQVVVNLLRNAFEALTDEPGASRDVHLRTRAVPDGVEVAVQDAGTGIPPEQFSQLFTTFYTSKPEGMGMGLSISKTIVEAHHGKIWATHNPHRGSTFHFIVPVGAKNNPKPVRP